jgi:hypothetical protein
MNNKSCLSDELFEKTMSKALDAILPKYAGEDKVLFITTEDTMQLLNISSPTTMQKIRNEGKIPYYQLTTKVIIYKKKEVLEYVENLRK